MAVIAQGEIDLRLSKVSAANIEKELSATAKKAGGKAGTDASQEFGNKFGGKLGGTLSTVEGKLKEFGKTGEASLKPLTLAQGGIGKLATSLESVGPAGAAAGVGLAALGAAAFAGIGKFVDLAADVRKFKSITGESAQESSIFVVGLRELGVSSDQVARGLSRLARASVDGKQPLADLGILIKRTKDGNFDAIGSFKAIADKIAGSTDAAYRNAVAFKAFGRAGLELIPILSRGGGALDEFTKIAKLRHEIFTDADLKAARDYTVATRSLGEAFDAVEISLGRLVIPILTSATTQITSFVDSTNNAAHGINGFIKAIDRNIPFLGALDDATGTTGISIDVLGDHAGQAAKKITDLATAEANFADAAKKDLKSVQTAANDLAFTQGRLAQNAIGANLDVFSRSAAGAAITLSTDLKSGVTDYSKALQLLDPIAARVADDQYKIEIGLDPLAAKFDLTAAAADQFTQALNLTLTPFENYKQAGIALTRQSDTLDKILGDNKSSLLDVQEGVLGYVQASAAYVDALIRESGGATTAAQGKAILLQQIDAEIKRRPALRTELQLYRDQIENTPAEKLIDFKQQGLSGKGGIQDSLDTLNATIKDLTKVFEIKFGIRSIEVAQAKADTLKSTLTAIAGNTFTAKVDVKSFLTQVGGGNLPQRAGGGGVVAGQSYIVGEKRAEVFTPSQNGTIHPDANAWARGQGKSVEQTNHINVYDVAGDKEATAFAVSARLAAALSL